MSTSPPDKPKADIAAPALNKEGETKRLDAEAASGNLEARPSSTPAPSGPRTNSAAGNSGSGSGNLGSGSGAPAGNTEQPGSSETESKSSRSDLAEMGYLSRELTEEWKPKGLLEEEIIDKIAELVFASRRAKSLASFDGCQDLIEESLERIETIRGIRRRMERNAALEKRWKFSRKPRREKD